VRRTILLFAIVFAAAIALFCFPALADVDGARSCMDLFADCRDAKNFLYSDFSGNMTSSQTSSASYCVGYLRGFADAGNGAFYHLSDAAPGSYVHPSCIPHEVTAAQLTLIFVSWAEQHSNALNMDAASCVLVAFGGAFPCPPEKKSP
jgi:hypothetical protein